MSAESPRVCPEFDPRIKGALLDLVSAINSAIFPAIRSNTSSLSGSNEDASGYCQWIIRLSGGISAILSSIPNENEVFDDLQKLALHLLSGVVFDISSLASGVSWQNLLGMSASSASLNLKSGEGTKLNFVIQLCSCSGPHALRHAALEELLVTCLNHKNMRVVFFVIVICIQ